MNDLHCCIIDQDLEKAYKARKLADKSDFVFRAGTKENIFADVHSNFYLRHKPFERTTVCEVRHRAHLETKNIFRN